MVSDSLQTAHAAYDSKVEGNVIITRLDASINWMRKNSLWPMPMGLACCGIELMAVGGARFDISRFGAEVMRLAARLEQQGGRVPGPGGLREAAVARHGACAQGHGPGGYRPVDDFRGVGGQEVA